MTAESTSQPNVRVPRRQLGARGPAVSVFGLGSWHTWDRAEFREAVRVARRAIDCGVNLFDVGIYRSPRPGGGLPSATDLILSRILSAAGVDRGSYLLASKVWMFTDRGIPGPTGQVDEALFRFGTDYADILVVGEMIDYSIDLEPLVVEIGSLLAGGKARWWGVNNWSAAELTRVCELADAHSVPRPTFAQVRYSLTRRSIAQGEPLRAVLERTGMAMQASDVMEGGILAGNLSPARPVGFDPGDLQGRMRELAPRIAELARRFGATPAQLALAYPLLDPRTASVLFGLRTLAQLEDNLGAIRLLDRHGAELAAATAGLWLDKDVVRADASWSVEPGADPAPLRKHIVEQYRG
ncbi:MAG: aldo/keto reductase [Burkholderiales bacterium]|nr:aldo/keto reductase [Burkholderiales bacterium]